MNQKTQTELRQKYQEQEDLINGDEAFLLPVGCERCGNPNIRYVQLQNGVDYTCQECEDGIYWSEHKNCNSHSTSVSCSNRHR